MAGLIATLGLWAAYWAAIFAQLAHLRARDDGVGAFVCAGISGSLLVTGAGVLLLTQAGLI